MSRVSNNVKAWRKRTKDRIIEAFGDKCCICGKSYAPELYDIHHIFPEYKEFSIGSIRANSVSWERIVVELKKCVMMCANCHRLVHNGYETIPEDCHKFNEDFAKYKQAFAPTFEICPVCGLKKRKPHNVTCSKQCAAKHNYKADWDNIDLLALYNEHKSYTAVGRILNVSSNTVKERIDSHLNRTPMA